MTRPARALHAYHPLRYHHRPRGRDDAHSYGQPSRFCVSLRCAWEVMSIPRLNADSLERPRPCSTVEVPFCRVRYATALRPDGSAWTPKRYRGSPHRSNRLRSSSMTALSQYLMENPPISGFATGRSHRRCMTTW